MARLVQREAKAYEAAVHDAVLRALQLKVKVRIVGGWRHSRLAATRVWRSSVYF